ncbi:hypothetical protein DFA_09163 [Cavenderia fasciculata]|uniref:Uncharacterized protein n=1 Tax=Cavenderia fasciculata TaxID=261658 RepID=F4Q6V6_CACFS|nr:uncharacterized protein DFA_09163 [Cavenderia fasciculata]EGG16138.1 hypothetical protein DFA_09163 [Cavenderia fasciculata]|eukprot:XP_004352591.1 hypothetical protein DFA_09163 [Cavenderia fasciculata]
MRGIKRKFYIEDIDDYQTYSSLKQLYKDDLIEICQVLEIAINQDDNKPYILDQILNHYNSNNNNNNNNNSQKDDDNIEQQQDNINRIYTEQELRINKQKVITICNDLKIEVAPSSLSGGYSLPWSIIASILTRAWNDAKYCTCIYPQEFQDLQRKFNQLNTREPYSFNFLGKQFNSKIGQFIEQVKSNNQHCPQHAMYYRDDSLYHPWAHYSMFGVAIEETQWKQTMPTISKKVFHHLSTTIPRTFALPWGGKFKAAERAEYETSIWSHISNEYNGIKIANRICVLSSNQVYLDAPPWFTKSIEHVTLDSLPPRPLLNNLSKLVHLKSIVYFGDQYPNIGPLKNLTSITMELLREGLEELVDSLDRPMKRLLLPQDPSVILKAKDIVLESLQVICLDDKLYMLLFQNTSQERPSSPRNLSNLRHVHIQYTQSRGIKDYILPSRISKLSASKMSTCYEDKYSRFFENNPHITSIIVDCDFQTIGIISTLLKQSRLSRIVVYSDYALTVQHQQLIQSNVYFNSSKDMSFRHSNRKYIFYRNDKHNNQIINNNNNNINNNNNNYTTTILLPTLPNNIIYKIIQLLWNGMNECNCDDSFAKLYSKTMTHRDCLLLKSNQDFESIQSNCPHHGWVDRSSLYLPVFQNISTFTQKSIYQLRLSKFSTISKTTRSFIFEKLFTKFGQSNIGNISKTIYQNN